MIRRHCIEVVIASVAMIIASFISLTAMVMVMSWVVLGLAIDCQVSTRRAERAMAIEAERARLAALPIVQPLWLCPVCERLTTPLVLPTGDGRGFRYECLRCEYRWTEEGEQEATRWYGLTRRTTGSSRSCRNGSRNGGRSS